MNETLVYFKLFIYNNYLEIITTTSHKANAIN